MSLTVPELIDALGGVAAVSAATGAGMGAIRMWKTRDEVPSRYSLPMWELALGRDIDWEPKGADAIRHLLHPTADQAAA